LLGIVFRLEQQMLDRISLGKDAGDLMMPSRFDP
jgi:hypothetical protein